LKTYDLDIDLNIDTDQLNNTTERELYYYDAITISHSGTTEAVDGSVLENAVTENDIFVSSGTEINADTFAGLVSYPQYTNEDSWKADYVTFSEAAYEPFVDAITHDSVFTLTTSLKAITEAPEAVISDVVAEKKKSFRIPVHVRHLISVNADKISVKIGGTNGASDQPGDFPAEGVYFPSDINDRSITVTI
jgi:hypothetical protein